MIKGKANYLVKDKRKLLKFVQRQIQMGKKHQGIVKGQATAAGSKQHKVSSTVGKFWSSQLFSPRQPWSFRNRALRVIVLAPGLLVTLRS